jgi:hypothetical protein
MTLAASPASIFAGGFITSHGLDTFTGTTNATTATPTGGAAPYSYQWAIVSSDGNTFSVDTPTNASTTVTCDIPQGATATCSIQCTCRDSTGLSAVSNTVVATFDNPAS